MSERNNYKPTPAIIPTVKLTETFMAAGYTEVSTHGIHNIGKPHETRLQLDRETDVTVQ